MGTANETLYTLKNYLLFGTYRWSFVSWEEVIVVFPLFVNACRWIVTGCPQQTACRTERYASAGKKAEKEILTVHFYWWLEKRRHSVLCSINISTGSNIIHNILQLTWCLSVLSLHGCGPLHGTGYIYCFIVYCWCCDHDPGPDCWSCNCFFRLLSSSTRLCTARLRQSASGSPSATSVDVETHYWLYLSVT